LSGKYCRKQKQQSENIFFKNHFFVWGLSICQRYAQLTVKNEK